MYYSFDDINRVCRHHRLSIAELCKKASINRSILDKWKYGITKPTLKSLVKVDRVLREYDTPAKPEKKEGE